MLFVLDRDGVINEDSDAYIKSPDEWHALPGALEAIADLKKQGHQVVVVTNQSGIGRGMYNEAMLEAIHKKMIDGLAAFGAQFDGIYYCPHHPDAACDCRKPLPGMFLQVAKDFDVDWSHALCVGDSLRDLQAAQAVGCEAVLVRTGKGERTLAKGEGLDGVDVYDDLAQVVRHYLKN